jgi:hypothetical protein
VDYTSDIYIYWEGSEHAMMLYRSAQELKAENHIGILARRIVWIYSNHIYLVIAKQRTDI